MRRLVVSLLTAYAAAYFVLGLVYHAASTESLIPFGILAANGLVCLWLTFPRRPSSPPGPFPMPPVQPPRVEEAPLSADLIHGFCYASPGHQIQAEATLRRELSAAFASTLEGLESLPRSTAGDLLRLASFDRLAKSVRLEAHLQGLLKSNNKN